MLYHRPVQSQVQVALADTPVVSILGPRQVGKSTLAKLVAPDRFYITLDDQNLLSYAINDSQGFIDSLPEYVIIDEVQRAPNLMLAIKKSVDENRKPGRFLLTGSANLLFMDQIQDSLAGRHEIIHLYPLSQHEINNTPSTRSFIKALLNNGIQPQYNAYPNNLKTLQQTVCRGGYPIPLQRDEGRAKKWFATYITDIINKDAQSVDTLRNPEALEQLLRLCAAQSASIIEINSVSKALQSSAETVKNYLFTLQKLFLIRRLPAWSNNMGKRLIKSPKLHLIDTGMCCALNNLSCNDWLTHASEFGHAIETMVINQLMIQLSWEDRDMQCYHFRDQNKREVDLVIEQARAVWGVEVKRSVNLVAADYRGLQVLSEYAGANWQGGVILYSGEHVLPIPVKNSFAVPFGALWDGIGG